MRRKVQLVQRALRTIVSRLRRRQAVVVRPLRSDDAAALFNSQKDPLARKWLRLQENGKMHVAVAEVDGVAVGRTCLRFNLRENPPYAYSFASYVLAQWRSRGIGSALIAHVEEMARSHGLTLVRAHTAKTNPRAAVWRERMGYRCLGEEIARWREVDGREVEVLCWKYEHTLGPGA